MPKNFFFLSKDCGILFFLLPVIKANTKKTTKGIIALPGIVVELKATPFNQLVNPADLLW